MESLDGATREQIVILAPVGRDGALVASVLAKQGLDAMPVKTMAEMCACIDEGIGTAVFTEESLLGDSLDKLTECLSRQQPWSDLPIILLSTSGEHHAGTTWKLVRKLAVVGNVSLLERPLRSITLLSAVQVALRARQKQYEVKALTEDLESRVQARTAELQRLTLEAEGFSYSISHDLRTPLRAIVSTSKTLLYDFGDQLPSEAKGHLQRQVQASIKMAALIDDLLNLSRLSRQEMNMGDFDLSRLAREVLGELQLESAAGACDWEVQPGMVAYGDPLLVRFVLQNLMHNACKFSPDGGTITVGQAGPGGPFFVRDEGVGFDMEYHEKIFMPFERLVREDEFAGTGIGLANAARIVQRHGGRIWVESQPGKGTIFYFCLSP